MADERALVSAMESASRAFRLSRMGLRIDGVKFDLSKYPYLIDILDDDHPDQCIIKGSQLGLTIALICRVIDRGIHRKYVRGAGYYFPTDDDVSDFSRARFARMLEDNAALRKHVGGVDSVGLRRVGDAYMYFRGAKSKSGVKSIPCDEVVFDEIDEMEPAQVEQIEHRLDAAMENEGGFNGLRTAISTPTIPDFGIAELYDKSDQHQWLVKCVHCNSWRCLEKDFIEDPEKFLQWNDDGTASYFCLECDRELERFGSEVSSQWVASKPDAASRGRWVSQLNSFHVSPAAVLRDFEYRQKRGSMQHLYNHRIGLPYAEIDDQLSREMVLAACSNEPRATAGEGPCIMGVDPGKRVLHYMIGERRADDLVHSPNYGVVDSFDDIGDLMRRFNVQICVVDEMAETRAVREFKKKTPNVWGCWYADKKKDDYTWNERERTVTVGRTESLDASHRRIIRKQTTFHKPQKLTHSLLVPQLTNMARIRETDDERTGKRTGQVKIRWVVVGTKNDHLRHADNYMEIAATRSPIVVRAKFSRERDRPTRKASSFMGG